MRFLLVCGNNSLSHVAKCLAVREELRRRGHEPVVAVSRPRSSFLSEHGVEHRLLPDIQQSDGSGTPTVEWFRQPSRVQECVAAERELLRELQPARALGVFRFTLKASAQLEGIPFDSLNCGCMMPDCAEPLGFRPDEPGGEMQQRYLASFYRYAAVQLKRSLPNGELDPRGDVRHMLVGDCTYLWDFPEFMPRAVAANVVHVGPVSWTGWRYDAVDSGALAGAEPLAVVSFGTCSGHEACAEKAVQVLLGMGYRVLFASCGQDALAARLPGHPRLSVCRFAPLERVLAQAALLVCHGGQLTVFDSLRQGVPVFVVPFQPEQAHNGVCLEQLGCGGRLVPAQAYTGSATCYVDAFVSTPTAQLAQALRRVLDDPSTPERLARVREAIHRYDGVRSLCQRLERTP